MKAPAGNRFADRSRKSGFGRLSSPVGSGGTSAPSAGRIAASLGLFASVLVLSLSLFGGAEASSAFAEACPNEALRKENNSLQLGDCRAFERVTPPFQNGFGDAGVEALAPGGEEMIVLSTPGFAGAESNRIGPYYKLTRTSSGWQTASISPPATLFPGNQFYSASADLSKSVWALRSPDESIYAQNLYLREPDGAFVEIGPMVPPSSESGPPAGGNQFFLGAYQFRGASADLSHVYFSIINGLDKSVLWPGDTTTIFGNASGAFSLYEYDGTGNTRPALVGVNTQGALISDCATYLGSDENQEEYNAVSENGEKAFFTADGHEGFVACGEEIRAPEVTEVYARVAGRETVAISEPTVQDCEACHTGSRKKAQFLGASADGNKVFFSTTQELLAGAETNNIFEYDFSAARGRRIRRISIGTAMPEVLGVARISEDGSHVYFVARGRLTDAPRGGCIAEETPTEQAEEELSHEGRCRPQQNKPNLYVYARDEEYPLGQVNFVATLAESESDEHDWAPVPSGPRPVQATPTGQQLVFDSTAPLTPEASGSGPQVFEYEAGSQELVRISRGQNGYPQGTVNANNSFAFITNQLFTASSKPTVANTILAISTNGSMIQFSSPAALTPSNEEAAAAGATSVYEYRSSGPIANGNVFPLGGGKETGLGAVLGVSPDGTNAFFSVSDPLVAGQTDSQLNIYDSRAYGGFSPVLSAQACKGELCLQGPPQPPAEPPPSGTLGTTAGNTPPPAHKKKHKKHNTKKRHGKKGHKKRGRANSDRGGHK